ncbi:MAG: LPS-assembly protein LptD [Melioribacteraceae bacterium]|nr:LPS-assembly protein LptD [Melioribacteraceae bacterium]
MSKLIFAQVDSSSTGLSNDLNFTDSLNTLQDSLSVFADSTITPKRKSDVDAIIYSSSKDSLIFDVKDKKLFIYGTGELKYKNTELNSGKIDLDFTTNELFAEGRMDSVKGEYVEIETPKLVEGSENYEGYKIKYNFKTAQGFISMAKNSKEDKSYRGDKVKKVNKDVFFIEDGIYTTCQADTPHTYFTADEMKVIKDEFIVAKWIFMHVGGVPIPIPIPFGVFPNETGRRSGIIIPSYGSNDLRGQYFRNFGYYFALSDYYDLTLNGDYYSKGGYGFRGRARYNKRYELSGNINAGYSKIIYGEDSDPDRSERVDWNIGINHNQTFDPTMRLVANLQFQSSTYLQNNSNFLNDQLTRNVTSNATLSKRWDESGNSLTVNYSRTQNLESGNITESLPNVNFNMPVSYPFKSTASQRDQSWYEKMGFNYSANFKNQRKKTDGELKIRGGFRHSISSSLSPKIGYFNISPRFGYSEKWYNKRIKRTNYLVEEFDEFGAVTGYKDTVVTDDIHEINAVRTFDFSLSASTKLYGTMQPHLLGVEAFRHTLTPSISYSYTPDFSKDTWGYYDEYTTSDGDVIRYDKFGNEIFGGASSGERQSVSFSLDNIFEIKTMKDPTDTTSQQEKIRLLNVGASTNYNFAADSLKLSDLSLSFRTQIGEFLNINGSSNYTFYDYNVNRKINQFLASNGKGLLRLTRFRFSLSTSISGDKLKGKDEPAEETDNDLANDQFNELRDDFYIGPYDSGNADFSIPWDISLSYNYNFNKPLPSDPSISSNLGITGSINLTEYWKIRFRGNYDIENKELTAPQITIFRDLHCWEMNFTWNPLGTFRGYRFEIRMKAPDLQDIKVEKADRFYSGFRGN